MSDDHISAPPSVRVIIVNYNGGAYLARCVAALSAQTGVSWEAVIVDNGSTDGSLDAIDLDDRFSVIEAGENLGFAAANNLGAREAKTRWIACLNPDAFARPHWLSRLVEGAEAEGVKMAGSTQVMAGDPTRFDGLGDGYHVSGLAWRMGFGHPVHRLPDAPYPVFGPCAAAALYDRDLFERLDGFDERFFCYHEDVDLAFRMRRAGATCLQIPDAVVDHVSSGITGRASDFAVYYGTRNRCWTFWKNMPPSGRLACGPAHLLMTLAIMIWSLFRPGRARPTWRGVRDALTGLPNDPGGRWACPDHVGYGRLLPSLTFNPLTVIARGVAPRPPLPYGTDDD